MGALDWHSQTLPEKSGGSGDPNYVLGEAGMHLIITVAKAIATLYLHTKRNRVRQCNKLL